MVTQFSASGPLLAARVMTRTPQGVCLAGAESSRVARRVSDHVPRSRPPLRPSPRIERTDRVGVSRSVALPHSLCAAALRRLLQSVRHFTISAPSAPRTPHEGGDAPAVPERRSAPPLNCRASLRRKPANAPPSSPAMAVYLVGGAIIRRPLHLVTIVPEPCCSATPRVAEQRLVLPSVRPYPFSSS